MEQTALLQPFTDFWPKWQRSVPSYSENSIFLTSCFLDTNERHNKQPLLSGIIGTRPRLQCGHCWKCQIFHPTYWSVHSSSFLEWVTFLSNSWQKLSTKLFQGITRKEWVVIQRRGVPLKAGRTREPFSKRTWTEYRNGFGSYDADYWFGN